MPLARTQNIEVFVESEFLPHRSQVDQELYAFAYHIRITNHGNQVVQLKDRHWVIADGNGEQREVRGEGVVGKQPFLHPGETFEYSSGSHLFSPVGTMHGEYTMENAKGQTFEVQIPCFGLEVPGVVN